MTMKKTLMLLLVTLLLPMSVAAQELYCVNNYSGVLTFYYDTMAGSRNGDVYYYDPNKYRQSWIEGTPTYKKVVFDPSVANARPTKCRGWFKGFQKLEEIVGLEYLNTEQVTDMASMFYECMNLTSIDLSHFNTSKCETMFEMFYKCFDLKSLNLSTFDTRRCKNMESMFYHCSGLTSLNVSNFNTSQCGDMEDMFCGCVYLTSLDLSNFDTSKCYDMVGMFYECKNLTSLDLSSFDFSNVEELHGMFGECKRLKTIYCNYDLSQFNMGGYSAIFANCNALVGLLGTSYSDHRNVMAYARPDVPGHPGYFTPRDCIFINGETVTVSMPSTYVSSMDGEGVGTVTYNPPTSRLYISNANVTSPGEGIFIPNSAEIVLVGKNKITSEGNALTLNTETTISGSGSLEIYSSNGYGLSFSEGLEAVGTGKLNIYGKLGALDGGKWIDNFGNTNYGNLNPSQLILLRSDGEHPVIHEVGMIDREDCVYSYDTYSFTTVAHSVIDVYSKKPVTKPFWLVPKEKITYYPVKLAGQRLNNYNCYDFNPMSLESGFVGYSFNDDQIRMLRLDNAKFVDYETDWDVGLEVNLQKFELRLKGDNSLVGNDENSLYGITFGEDGVDSSVKRDWRIVGVTGDDGKPATLRCSGTIYFESTDNEADVTFTNVNLTDEKEAYLWSQDDVNVTFDNCSVDLWDKREKPNVVGSIMEALGVVTLNGCHFENGCYWDAEMGEVKNSSGKAEQRHVCIRREGESAWLLGDVNGDGNINSADVQKVYALMAQNADGNNHPEADVNGDGYVNSADIQKIYAIMATK